MIYLCEMRMFPLAPTAPSSHRHRTARTASSSRPYPPASSVHVPIHDNTQSRPRPPLSAVQCSAGPGRAGQGKAVRPENHENAPSRTGRRQGPLVTRTNGSTGRRREIDRHQDRIYVHTPTHRQTSVCMYTVHPPAHGCRPDACVRIGPWMFPHALRVRIGEGDAAQRNSYCTMHTWQRRQVSLASRPAASAVGRHGRRSLLLAGSAEEAEAEAEWSGRGAVVMAE